MDNRVVDPLALTDKTSKLLTGYLKRRLVNGRLLQRNQKFFFDFETFTLAYDLLIREKSPGIWHVDVIASEGGSQTRCGYFYPVLAVIKVPLKDDLPLEINKKNKRIVHLQNKDGWYEFELMKRCPHLQARGLFANIPSMVSLCKPAGEPLIDVLNRDRKNIFLTIDERYRMTIECLRALKNQIHRVGICHKGIKPDTLYYDKDTCGFSFMDLDISKLMNDDSDMRARGNVVFSAPEEFTSIRSEKPVTLREYIARVGMKSVTNEKSDVYSVARLIGLIWRDIDAVFTDPYHAPAIMEKRIRARWLPEFNLFQKMQDLPVDEKSQIATQLKNMTLLDADKRPHLDACIAAFQAMYLNRRLSSLSFEDKHDVQTAHALALQLSANLESLCTSKSILKEFTTTLDMLSENTSAINYFIEALGVKCLQGLTIKSEIISKISAVFAMYDCFSGALVDRFTEASAAKNIILANELNALLKSAAKRCYSIDGVAEVADHFARKLTKLENDSEVADAKKRANSILN